MKIISMYRCLMKHEYSGYYFITPEYFQYGGEAELFYAQSFGAEFIKFAGDPIHVEIKNQE